MVCRKRSCYDTRNCFIDSLASRLHILQFVTWPISIFQADVDKNPSAPHTRLHFVMTWRMHGGRGQGLRRATTFFLLPVPSCPPPPPCGRRWKGIASWPALTLGFCMSWSSQCLRFSLPSSAPRQSLIMESPWNNLCPPSWS